MININKIAYGAFVVAIVVVVICGLVANNKIHRLHADIARLELQLSECGQRERDAATAIDRQNAAIEAARVDTVVITEKVDNIAMKYAIMRDTITRSVHGDMSCENSIKNIDYALRRYHGVGLHD